LQVYKKSLGPSFNVVENGGWYALEQKANAALASSNFDKLRPNLKTDVVQAGGWNAVKQLSADPKGELLQILHDSSSSLVPYYRAIIALLEASGKGFESSVVDGEWILATQSQGFNSPLVQKFVSNFENSVNSYSNFNVEKEEFYGTVKVLGGLGEIKSTVEYRPVADNFSQDANGKIVLRRVACDITDATFKFWKLPKLSLPLKVKGGYLDFLYLDQDIRVTRGNRGGLFVHTRPDAASSSVACACSLIKAIKAIVRLPLTILKLGLKMLTKKNSLATA
jgi:hypothetical protein